MDRDRPGRLRRRVPARPDRAREVLVAGERRQVVGAVSMDAFAVELDRRLRVGAAVTIVGRRPAARGARACRRHDHLRAREPDRDASGASPPRRASAAESSDVVDASRVRSGDRPGASAWSQPRGGTSAARRSRAGPSRRRRGCARRRTADRPRAGPAGARSRARCGNPGVSTKPGSDRVHRDAARRELDRDRARERELGVLRGGVGPDRDERRRPRRR